LCGGAVWNGTTATGRAVRGVLQSCDASNLAFEIFDRDHAAGGRRFVPETFWHVCSLMV